MMTNNQNRRIKAALLAACAATTLVPAFAYAQAQQQSSYNIAAQDLGTALTELARQSNREIYFSADLTRGKRAPRLSGRMSLETALDRLLDGTGLRYRIGANGSIVVEAGQVGNAPTQETGESGEQGNSEILVTGTRLNSGEIAAPVSSTTRRDIERSGVVSTEDLVRRLPQNYNSLSPTAIMGAGAATESTSNSEYVSGINLRGLGAQSTLVLVNGERRAGGNASGNNVDVSSLPLALIDRVDVVTGGNSAIYGSDAVAGVVNFVLRRKFDGAQGSVRYTAGEHGYSRAQYTATVGREFGAIGGFALSYTHSDERPSNFAQSDLIVNPGTGGTWRFLPNGAEFNRDSLFASGEVEPLTGVKLFADFNYTWDESVAPTISRKTNANSDSVTFISRSAPTFSTLGGITIDLGNSWSVTAKANISRRRFKYHTANHYDFGTLVLDNEQTSESRSANDTYSIDLQGNLPALFGVTPEIAIGVEHRQEMAYGILTSLNNKPTNALQRDIRRNIDAVYGEILLPLVIQDSGLIRKAQLTLAGRYDRYSDFGGAFNPQLGGVLELGGGVKLRGTYSTAFRAPELDLIYYTANPGSPRSLTITNRTDPLSPTGSSPTLTRSAYPNDLGPEHARTFTLSIDYNPTFAPWLTVGGSYFNVRYRDRLTSPISPIASALINERYYPGLIIRNPTPAQVADFTAGAVTVFNNSGVAFNPATQTLLGVFPNIVLLDSETTNIAVENVDGIDANLKIEAPVAGGTLRAGVNATYTLTHVRRATAAAPAQVFLNQVGLPASFRMNGNLGFERGPISIDAYLTHVGGYQNQFSTVSPRVKAGNIVDLTVRFDTSHLEGPHWVRGLVLSASIRNLLDTRPPLVVAPTSYGLRYDPANSDGSGRMISLEITKRF